MALDVLDVLFDSAVISASYIQKRFGVTYVSASKTIQRLIEMGILKDADMSKKRSKLYYAEAILNIIS